MSLVQEASKFNFLVALSSSFLVGVGYPHEKTTMERHYYNILMGLVIGYLFLGVTLLHFVPSLVFMSLLLPYCKKFPVVSFWVCFLFHMVYLLSGYYVEEKEEQYGLNWTLPYCFHCLKMIGVAADETTVEKKESVTILELSSYTFFPAIFLAGPPLSLSKYLEFMQKYAEPNRDLLRHFLCSGTVLVEGLFYYVIYHYLSKEYNFNNWKEGDSIVRLMITSHVLWFQYFSVWKIVEALALLYGMVLINVKPWNFLTASSIQQCIESWNIYTNSFAKQYIYKRCAPLKSKMISLMTSLLFLALWHGFHLGYFLAFIIEGEWFLLEQCWKNEKAKHIHTQTQITTRRFKIILVKLSRVVIVSLGFAFFGLKDTERCLALLKALYYLPFLFPLPFLFFPSFFSPSSPSFVSISLFQ